jgi:uncharacterized protein YqjF (DUF2071 family)
MTPGPEQRLEQQKAPAGFPVMKQRWSELGFFHWQIPANLVQERLPKGLHVDTFDGHAWIGIVPFLMQRIRPVGLPPVPWISWFHELNLRTYVHDDSGTPGVWFFSLDCNQPVAVEIARKCFHLPYEHARMRSIVSEHTVEYFSQRSDITSDEAKFQYSRPIAPKPAVFGSLEWFLIERYTLFSSDSAGHLYSGRVHHQPYQIETMSDYSCSTLPFRWNGFPEPISGPVSCLCAKPVSVTVYPLKFLR